MEEENSQVLKDAAKDAHAENKPEHFSMRFQLLATILVIVMALMGGTVGYVLYDVEADDDLVSWVALPGDLFIRALNCLVLPLVFVNVILAVIQMMETGKAGKVGKYTVLVYLLTTFIASIEGLLVLLIFEDQFSTQDAETEETFINFLCPTDGFTLVLNGSSIICKDSDEVSGSEADFYLDDVNGYFYTYGDAYYTYTFSETLQYGIFYKLVPENIVEEFYDGNIAGISMFGIMFAAALNNLKRQPTLLIHFLEDVNDILVRVLQWIIFFTPVAVFSLITGALAEQDDLVETMQDVVVLILASFSAVIAHLLVIYPGLFYFFTRQNPYAYMRYIAPAQIFGFSSASSTATLPVTMRCVTETKQVPDSIRDFVLPIGATLNLDGTALYFPPALIFLAKTAGISSGAAEYFLVLLVSAVGSAGAASVSNAGLVLIITAFNTVYGGSGIPENFAIIVGIDWLMERMQTAINVTGDAMVARIVTTLADADLDEGKATSTTVSQEQAVTEAKAVVPDQDADESKIESDVPPPTDTKESEEVENKT